jgi:NADH-quinone oxidoreductase subunit G
MPTFKIDGREVPFEKGETVIQAAQRAGIDIPHYCWHPGLSVAANCRMCLVEVAPPPGRPALMLNVLSYDPDTGEYVDQQKPKLQPACQQAAAEGLDIRSESSKHVARARAAVQEFLLLNHPVDCPICDQAGECRLQDYWLEHQHEAKRMRDEPVHKPKAQVFGPTIVYDAERCIVCTRCVRFCEEVAQDPVLSVRERGNVNEIVVSPGRQLDNPYTLMTEYVCPVGALTASDFRFKARVWFLRSSRSVCQGCATGCNAYLDYDPRNQTVYRHRPRENAQVNRYWMCDEGMLDYQRAHENRLSDARLGSGRSSRGGTPHPETPETVPVGAALDRAAELLRSADPSKVAVLFSAQHSLEDNFALLDLAPRAFWSTKAGGAGAARREPLSASRVFATGRPAGEGDQILRHQDKNPNSAGVAALLAPVRPQNFAALSAAIDAGAITHVLALGSDIDPGNVAGESRVASLGRLQALITLGTWEGPLSRVAHVVLPASSWAESDGQFMNAQGLVQESEQAVQPLGQSRPAWKLAAAIGVRLGLPIPRRTLEELRAALAGRPQAPEPASRRSLQPGAVS